MMFRKRRTLALSAACLTLLLVTATAYSASKPYPAKAIDVVVPVNPGGGVDTIARVIAKHMAAQLAVPVNIVNKPGGRQIPGVMSVLNASADGYTLLADAAASSTLLGLERDVPFKIEDRTYLTLLVEGRSAYFISGKSPHNTLREVLDAAKKDPGSFTWVYQGGSTISDFASMVLLLAAGVDVSKTKPVSFTGSGPGMTAVAGNHVVFGAVGSGAVKPLMSSGNLKVVAVAGDKRASSLPNVPSTKEAGYDVSASNVYGLSGPKALPKGVIDRIDAMAKKLAADPAFIKDVESLGSEVSYLSPEQARQRILGDREKYRTAAVKFPKL